MTMSADPRGDGPTTGPLESREENLAVEVTARAALARVQAWAAEGRCEHALQEACRVRLLLSGARTPDGALSELLQVTSGIIDHLQQQGAPQVPFPPAVQDPPKGVMASLLALPTRTKTLAVVLVVLVGALVGGLLRGHWITLQCRASIAECISVAEEGLATAKRGVTLEEYSSYFHGTLEPAEERVRKALAATTVPGAKRPSFEPLYELERGTDLMHQAMEIWEARVQHDPGISSETISAQAPSSDETVRAIQYLWNEAQAHLSKARDALDDR